MTMRRATGERVEWAAVSEARPCPVCGAISGCSVAEGEQIARCRASVSALPVQGGGWLHVLSESGQENDRSGLARPPTRLQRPGSWWRFW